MFSSFLEGGKAGFITVLYSVGSRPLQLWTKHIEASGSGTLSRASDEDIQRGSCIQLTGSNVSTNYIRCPPRGSLGITMPYLCLILKNMSKDFSFEVGILDDSNTRRRFRASNYSSNTRISDFMCSIPMKLDSGWNLIVINLSDFVKKAYGTSYASTEQIQIHANCRIRRIYFSDRLYSDEELPTEYKLFLNTRSR